MERIVIVINKSWEADAALAAMFNPEFKKDDKGFPKKYADWYKDIKNNKVIQEMGYPIDETKNHSAKPRIIYTNGSLQVEVWCLNNVMPKEPTGKEKDDYFYSRTQQKAVDFPKILNYSSDPIKLLVAFGTAGLPSELSKNGGVVVGSSAFAFNFFDSLSEKDQSERTKPRYESKRFGEIIKSSIDQKFFDSLNLAMADASLKIYFEGAALSTPSNPASLFPFMADKNLVAISDMNTEKYADFKEGDKKALASFKEARTKEGDAFKNQIPMSIETTHSIMRLESTTDNFIFITAITDRVAYFESEVSSRELAQNFSASFNGGIFLNWFVPFCFDYFSTLDKPVA